MLSRGATQSVLVEMGVEKSFMVCLIRPYRKPTQVGECKRTQARERDLSKELGTLAP